MRRPFKRAIPDRYKAPGTDSARARADAVVFLVNTRSLDGVSSAELARRHKLKPVTAQRLLEDEIERRSKLL